MKIHHYLFTALLAALTFTSITPARADVAILELQFGKEKTFRRVVIDLSTADAPLTVANFEKLAHKGYYRNMAFHRAFPNYLVQVGDPFSKDKDRSRVGTGGPGYTLPPEIRGRVQRGSVAMARLPDKINPSRASNGSQFFIALKPIPDYNGKYTVFGNVIQGIEVLEEISRQAVDSNDNPLQRITIKSVQIAPAAPAPETKPVKESFLQRVLPG